MAIPGYNALTKGYDEAKTFRVTLDRAPASSVFTLDIFASLTTKTPEVTKEDGIAVVDSSFPVVEIAFTEEETADLALGVHYYRVMTGTRERVAFGPLLITNVAPGGAP